MWRAKETEDRKYIKDLIMMKKILDALVIRYIWGIYNLCETKDAVKFLYCAAVLSPQTYVALTLKFQL